MALVPDVVRRLGRARVEVVVEAGAGAGAMIPDALYEEAGARIALDAAEVWGAPLVVKVAPPIDAGVRAPGARRGADRVPEPARQRAGARVRWRRRA